MARWFHAIVVMGVQLVGGAGCGNSKMGGPDGAAGAQDVRADGPDGSAAAADDAGQGTVADRGSTADVVRADAVPDDAVDGGIPHITIPIPP